MNTDQLRRVVELMRAGAPAEPDPDYACGACRDTGWIEVDDGLEDGRRVRAPREARCNSILHARAVVPARAETERFS